MYKSSLDHLLAELEVIDLMIQYQVIRFRHFHEREDEFRGLYISRDEVDALLTGRQIAPTWYREPPVPELPQLAEMIDRKRVEVRELTDTSLAGGVPLSLPWLGATFRLNWFEMQALLVALAPELDLRFERLYAYLQNDVTRRRPTVGLILDLLCPSMDAKVRARSSFHARSPLLRHSLVHTFSDPSDPAPMLRRAVKIDDRIVDFLLDSDVPDVRIIPYLDRRPAQLPLDELILPPEIRHRIRNLQSRFAEEPELVRSGHCPICLLFGPDGSGRRSTATGVCRAIGLQTLVLAADRLLTATNVAETIALAAREARLINAALYIDRLEALLAEDGRGILVRDALIAELVEFEGLAFLASETLWQPPDILLARGVVRLDFPIPSFASRRMAWERVLGEIVDVETVASRFRFTPGRIQRAAKLAREEAWLSSDARPSTADVMVAARNQTTLRLGTMAQKIPLQRSWPDLVLPAESFTQLHELCEAVRARDHVLTAWGFERKLTLGKGLNALFAGPAGTGKTLAAEIIASDIGLDLYRIDLASIVSKYIGETEKNLSRIFAEAQMSSVVLFFDEADALFGKRSEVKDAHDRYANIEIAYLLQQMEVYDGLTILATNLKQNIDEAFLRRMYATVEFPFPDEVHRERIWRTVFPAEVPLAEEVDFGFLARAFAFSGGNIKNVALTSAYLAAEEGVVRMVHLIKAARRELVKMGRPVLAADFGPYASVIDVG